MIMGKKKPQKTKELSVAIAEASSTGTGDDTQQPQTQQQNQPHTPRKRGRPRKITEKTEISKEDIAEEAGGGAEVSESLSKKGKTIEGEEQGQEQEQQQRHAQQQEGSSACTQFSKDPKGEPSRSRARRKSKPRKSS
ncbi:uncharacterized protein LOC114716827 [Neltuma alba]|uniref:uncharacterized protein LOC114716827 n=1 Tax=Neltuma alba TaxID=207710 RepID=UPI0010A37E98|nr:uncharacterized protein LOC114716827 [Prosopis alba]